MIEILTEKIGNEKRVRGALAVNVRAMGLEEMYAVFSAENIVYATGGEAGMYETSVYPVSQTGGLGTALREKPDGITIRPCIYQVQMEPVRDIPAGHPKVCFYGAGWKRGTGVSGRVL